MTRFSWLMVFLPSSFAISEDLFGLRKLVEELLLEVDSVDTLSVLILLGLTSLVAFGVRADSVSSKSSFSCFTATCNAKKTILDFNSRQVFVGIYLFDVVFIISPHWQRGVDLVKMRRDYGSVPVHGLAAAPGDDAARVEPPLEVVRVLPLVLGDAAGQPLEAVVRPEVEAVEVLAVADPALVDALPARKVLELHVVILDDDDILHGIHGNVE